MNIGISIIVPTYNQHQYIEKTIRSVIDALGENDEAVFVDDASSDSTYDIIEAYSLCSNKIRCFKNELNRGHIYTLNRGVELARSNYITIIGGDDLLSFGFCDSIRPFLISSNASVFFPPVISFSRAEPDLNFEYDESKRDKYIGFLELGFCWGNHWGNKYSIIGCTFRKEVFISVGCFSEGYFVEDHSLFIRIAKAGYKLMLVSSKPSFYRMVPGSLSSKTALMLKEDLRIVFNYYAIPIALVMASKRLFSFARFILKKKGY